SSSPRRSCRSGCGNGGPGGFSSGTARHGVSSSRSPSPAFASCTGAAARPWSACTWRRWKGGPGRMRVTSSRSGSEDTSMTGYVHPTEQLVTEILVRDIRRSRDFYLRLGFELLRDGGDFIELTWEDHRLFLAELSAFHDVHDADVPAPSWFPFAYLRVMVTNVDDSWRL